MTPLTFDEIRRRLAQRPPKRAAATGRAQAAVAVVLAAASHGPEMVFIRRLERDNDPWSGQMGLPGGRRDARDPTLLATAQRETKEELGLTLPAAGLLGELDDLVPTTPELPPVVVRPFVFGLSRKPELELSDEVADIAWVGLRELPRLERYTTVRVRGVALEVPAFVFGPAVVWGMTHRIVKPFIDLLV